MNAATNLITEESIRKKLNINHDNLDDIKSLSVPGTYNEKITHLGNSLIRFTRLKELDLSRNSLISLDGLESLKLLEKLNLYYNNISSLKELEKLRHNTLLVDIDLRLNPITKEENDYRLYLIYIIPTLKVLDDRLIKDSERQMAESFFDPQDIRNNSSKIQNQCKNNYDTYNNLSRVRSVSNIAKRSAGISDQEGFNDINSAGLLSGHHNSRLYESATNLNDFPDDESNFLIKKPQAQEYSPKALKEIGNIESKYYSNSILNSNKNARSRSCSMLNLNLEQLSKENGNHQSSFKTKSVHFNEIPIYQDNKPEDFDESEAYNSYKSRGSFTPNPYYDNNPANGSSNEKLLSKVDSILNTSDLADLDSSESKILKPNNNDDHQTNNIPLIVLLDLVDRYWNGSKSLHKNAKFLNAANQLFINNSNLANSTDFDYNCLVLGSNESDKFSQTQKQLISLQDENKKLNQQLAHFKSSSKHESETQYKEMLLQIDDLKKRYLASQEENKKLRKDIQERNEKLIKEQTLDSIENQNGSMKRDIEIMRIKLKQYEQLQQLTVMLQESHKSLVTTNEHLLNEISNQKHCSLKMNPLINGNSEQTLNNNQNNSYYSPQGFDNAISPSSVSSPSQSSVINQQNMAKHLIRKQFDQFNNNLSLLKNYK